MERISKITDYTNPKAVGKIARGRSENWWNKNLEHYRKNQTFSSKNYLPIEQNDVEELVKTYNLKGLEFGNWMTQGDREDAYLCLRFSLKNLESILGKNIGFDAHIGIAIGARGTGGKAMAHFEPSQNMINMTKTKGANSLAHEYGHALDYNFGNFKYQSKKSSFLSYGSSTIYEEPLPDKKDLRYFVNYIVNYVYKKNGRQLIRLGDYWIRRTEVFARTFEQIIEYKLGSTYDYYLTKTAQQYQYYANEYGIYLKTEDLKAIMPEANQMLKLMKQELAKK